MNVILSHDVDTFIDTLEKSTRSKWFRHLELLQTYGRYLGMPHARRIDASLSELRIRGKQEVRAFLLLYGRIRLYTSCIFKENK